MSIDIRIGHGFDVHAFGDGDHVMLGGVRVPLVGRVSMDQCVVDLSDAPDARPGDVVTLFGRDERAELSLDEYAGWSDTIVHEALCRIGPRVPRRYQAGSRSWWGNTSDALAGAYR